jgi:hypothetical protein
MIWDRNAFWMGLIAGLVLPFVGYAILLTIFEQLEAAGFMSSEGFAPNFRQRTVTLVALCLNIFPFNYYYKRRFTNSMRGIAVVTVLYAVAWVITFGKDLFN